MNESKGSLTSDSYDDDTMGILLEIMPKHAAHGELLDDNSKIEEQGIELPESWKKSEIHNPKEGLSERDEGFGGSVVELFHIEVPEVEGSSASTNCQDKNLHESHDGGFYSGDEAPLSTEGSSSSGEESMYSPSSSPRSTVDPLWGAARENPSWNLANSEKPNSQRESVLDSNASHVIESNQQVIVSPVTDGSSLHRRPSGEKALLDDSDEEDYSYDCEGWQQKPIILWNENDTKSWLSDASIKIGQLYREISPKLVMPGDNLLLLAIEDWLLYDDKFGKRLHDLLHQLNNRIVSPTVPPIEDGTTAIAKRPEKKKPKEHSSSLLHLFVISLLDNPEYCPSIISWINYEKRIFRFNATERVAQLWGEFGNKKFRKNKIPRNFRDFTRAMRHHYRTGKKCGTGPAVFVSHPVRTIYQFGPDAIGYRNADRKFEHYREFVSLIEKHKLPFLQRRRS